MVRTMWVSALRSCSRLGSYVGVMSQEGGQTRLLFDAVRSMFPNKWYDNLCKLIRRCYSIYNKDLYTHVIAVWLECTHIIIMNTSESSIHTVSTDAEILHSMLSLRLVWSTFY